MNNIPEILNSMRMSLELIDTIKNISARIDELRMATRYINEKHRDTVIKRIDRLSDTRMKLICSFKDINSGYTDNDTNPFNSFDIKYKEFTSGIK